MRNSETLLLILVTKKQFTPALTEFLKYGHWSTGFLDDQIQNAMTTEIIY